MTIKVSNDVPVYEVDGAAGKLSERYPPIKVLSHWNRREFVVIETPDGKRYTVAVRDLRAATENASNTAR